MIYNGVGYQPKGGWLILMFQKWVIKCLRLFQFCFNSCKFCLKLYLRGFCPLQFMKSRWFFLNFEVSNTLISEELPLFFYHVMPINPCAVAWAAV